MPGRIRNVVHIKHRTAGTSNELSFDVLEAKKHAADNPGKRGPSPLGLIGRLSKPGNRVGQRGGFQSGRVGSDPDAPTTMPKLYTNDANIAAKNIERVRAPYQDPSAEVARRKRRRFRRRVLSACVGIAVVGAMAIVLSSEVARYTQEQSEIAKALDEALDMVKETDETIVGLDKLLSYSVADWDSEEVDRIAAQFPETLDKLDQAYEQAKYADGSLMSAEKREAAEQVLLDIKARREMILQGEKLLGQAEQAKQASSKMRDAWKLILRADALTNEAGDLVEDTTTENVNASMDKSNEAIGVFNDALDVIAEVESDYPDADVSSYRIYIEKRLEGQKAALESDASMLLMDREAADESNQKLYEIDISAAEIAAGFPEDPAQPIYDAYEASCADLRDKYHQARSQAATADASLREYLGTSDK